MQTNFVCSQAYKVSTKDTKAERYYYEARAFMRRAQFKEAEELLSMAIDRDNRFFEAYYALGTVYERTDRDSLAVQYFEDGLVHDSEAPAAILFALANLYYERGAYAKTIEYLEPFIIAKNATTADVKKAKKMLASCKYSIEQMKHPLDFAPEEMQSPINTFSTQYFPVLTVDQEQFLFTVRKGNGLLNDEDIYISFRSDTSWTTPVSISKRINTDENQGANAISADGRKLIFTSCNAPGGLGSCDLYVSEKEGDQWSAPRNLGARVNSRSWDSQPSLSADGRTLFFSSNRPGGFGGRDIWMSTQNNYGEWTKAINIGEAINTAGEETSPFIHANGQTLYFSSNYYIGFGGFDFYRVEKSDSSWSTPHNLGYPLNDHEDQISFFITADGLLGYFSKEVGDRYNSKSTLYSFKVPEEVSVKNRSTFLKGVIRDADTKEPLRAQVELYDLKAGNMLSRFFSDAVTGKYLAVLTAGSEYGLFVKKQGYLFEDVAFDLRESMLDEPLVKNIDLRPVKIGEKVALNNIFFDFNSFELDKKSKVELKEIYKFLRTNPKHVIEIQAHTDNKGSDAYNDDLSMKRARAVYDFLVRNGVPARMLTFKGYGASRPLVDNTSERNRQRNRRVEFEIVK